MKSKILLYGSLIFIAVCSLAAATCFAYAAVGQGSFFKENLTITTPDYVDQYCGDYITIENNDYAIEDGQLALGDYIVVRPNTQTFFDAGVYRNELLYSIYNANGQNVTSSYNIKEDFGTILINKRKVNVGIKDINPEDVGNYLTGENLEITGDGLAPNDQANANVTKEYIGDSYGFKFTLFVYNSLYQKDVSNNYYVDTGGESNLSFPNFDFSDLPDDFEFPNLDELPGFDELPDIDDLPEFGGDGDISFDGSDDFNFGSNSLPGYENFKEPVFTLSSGKTGDYYLKGTSYGDYNGSGFEKAPIYENKNYNANNFFSNLINSYQSKRTSLTIKYTSNVTSYDYDLVPYFYDDYVSQENDVYYKIPHNSDGSYTVNAYYYVPQTNLDTLEDLSFNNDVISQEESNYYEFVVNNYTSIDSSLRDDLMEFIYSKGLDTSSLAKFNDSLVKLFRDEYKYTTMAYVSSTGDTVYDFLTSERIGSCQNFASSATLLYRTLGYPARFVTGFLAPYKTANVETAYYGINGHAWTEVYIQGKGWVPLEYTVAISDTILGGANDFEDGEAPDDSNATNTGSGEDLDFSNRNDDESIKFTVKPSAIGKYYLRKESYGDYSIDGFSDANIYTVNENPNPNEFISNQLENSDFEKRELTIKNVVSYPEKALTPTYFINDGDNAIAHNDIYYDMSFNNEETIFSSYSYEYSSDSSLLDSLSFSDSNYKEAESLYYYFAKENYLEVPDDIKSTIINTISEYSPIIPSDPKLIVSLISEYLGSSNLAYNPDAQYDLSSLSGPIDDILNNRLYECDSCLIASAATLLLRSLNIPTRLVNGYLYVAHDTRDGTVDSSNNYYWNEIYIKGHGWVYVDFVSSSGIFNEEVSTDKNVITIKSDDYIVDYDGENHFPNVYVDYANSEIKDNDQIIFYNKEHKVNAGVYEPTFNIGIYDNYGNDVSNEYTFDFDFGDFIINKRKISLYTTSISADYEEGKVLEATIDRIENFDTTKFTYEGKAATLSSRGSIDATYIINAIYNIDGEDVFDNFEITYYYGKLEMI